MEFPMEQRKLPYVWKVKKGRAESLFCGTAHVICHSYEDSIKKLLKGRSAVLIEHSSLDFKPEKLFSGEKTGPSLEQVLSKPQLGIIKDYEPFFERVYGTGRNVKELTIYGFYSLSIRRMVEEEGFYCIDKRVEEIAREEGVKVVGVETLDELIEHFVKEPGEMLKLARSFFTFDVLGLKRALAYAGELYAGRSALYRMAIKNEIKSLPRLVGFRNGRMEERCKPYLEEGGAVVAFGLAHFLGEGGLVKRFKNQGYKIKKFKET